MDDDGWSSDDSAASDDDGDQQPPLANARVQLVLLTAQFAAIAVVDTLRILSESEVPPRRARRRAWHNSILTGRLWVEELLQGHPGRLRLNLGVSKPVFTYLERSLHILGCPDGRWILVPEQLAIFLYICVTGLSINHVAERFQHSPATISKYVPHFF